MPFLIYRNLTINKIINDEIPLRIVENSKKHSFLKENAFHFIRYTKRVSLYLSPSISGSMTVETALIFPFFLFAILAILSVINIIGLQSNMTMALREAGLPMSAYGYAFRSVEKHKGIQLDGVLANVGLSQVYLSSEVKCYLGKNYLDSSPLERGSKGINYMFSTFMESGDVIDLVALYEVCPEFKMVPLSPIRLFSRLYIRAWTGYDVGGSKETELSKEPNVFITPEGEAYHEHRSCTYLQLTIKEISKEELSGLHNEEGESYSPCLQCGIEAGEGRIYITSYGNKYHGTLSCSGIKRTIDVVPRSGAGWRTPCTRCAEG